MMTNWINELSKYGFKAEEARPNVYSVMDLKSPYLVAIVVDGDKSFRIVSALDDARHTADMVRAIDDILFSFMPNVYISATHVERDEFSTLLDFSDEPDFVDSSSAESMQPAKARKINITSDERDADRPYTLALPDFIISIGFEMTTGAHYNAITHRTDGHVLLIEQTESRFRVLAVVDGNGNIEAGIAKVIVALSKIGVNEIDFVNVQDEEYSSILSYIGQLD